MAAPYETQRIAIISDPHAFSGQYKDSSPSWLALGDDQANPRSNPFAGIEKLIAKDGLCADVVICGGDLGDKASPEGQQYVWQQIHRVKESLGAKLVVGTAGNHDIDSRLVHTDHDARGQIQALSPLFPIADPIKWMEYWAQNFTIVEHAGVRFVLLNSSAYHGYAKEGVPAEYNQGRVSDRTLDRLMKELQAEPVFATNILLCHHHPYKNDVIKIADYSEMKNGDRLVNDLINLRKGPWLIVHGHKHVPRVFYAPGGNASPAIFSAGSFSAKLWQETFSIARNEFYIMELQVPKLLGAGTSVKGRIKSWQWSYGNGWVLPRVGEGLGPIASFGTRMDTGDLAAEIFDYLRTNFRGKTVLWQEIAAFKPAVDYLIPDDLRHLLEILADVYQIKLVSNFETGLIEQLQVPA